MDSHSRPHPRAQSHNHMNQPHIGEPPRIVAQVQGAAPSSTYLDHLSAVAQEDVEGLLKAEKSYGDSWKKRGGVGAYMMLARKWDRMDEALKPGDGFNGPTHQAKIAHNGSKSEGSCPPWDIFGAAQIDRRTEGIIDDIRDLRRYLMLVEAHLRAQGIVHGKHRDNQ